MKLERENVAWALDSIARGSDSDLFPPTEEFIKVAESPDALLKDLTEPELQSLKVGDAQRFLVPKDEVSYRQATQLDPQDGLVLTALMHQFGQNIEDRRLDAETVFSYRFEPSNTGLYLENSDWNRFWESAIGKSRKYKYVLYADIADFYNQIAHHTLENQLAESHFPNQAIKWIIDLLKSTTSGISRGVPIGPHAIHLLAEASLIPIDNSLRSQGINFVRFVDDIAIFCNTKEDAQSAIYTLAKDLDRQQHLLIQRHKTKIYKSRYFRVFASLMSKDQPISTRESELLSIVKKYSHGNPYATVWYTEIEDSDWAKISPKALSSILNEYLSAKEVDYARLGWFYRRLAQVGHPGALEVTLKRIDDLTPALPSVVSYIASLQTIEDTQWRGVGDKLLAVLNKRPFSEQEYFMVMILGLFARNPALNHFELLTKRWPTSAPAVRRQIIHAAKRTEAIDWLRNLKEEYPAMSNGQKLAFMDSMEKFPRDERNYFIRAQEASLDRPFIKAVAKISR